MPHDTSRRFRDNFKRKKLYRLEQVEKKTNLHAQSCPRPAPIYITTYGTCRPHQLANTPITCVILTRHSNWFTARLISLLCRWQQTSVIVSRSGRGLFGPLTLIKEWERSCQINTHHNMNEQNIQGIYYRVAFSYRGNKVAREEVLKYRNQGNIKNRCGYKKY